MSFQARIMIMRGINLFDWVTHPITGVTLGGVALCSAELSAVGERVMSSVTEPM